MDREEFLRMIDDVGTCESEADRRSMLNTMREHANNLFDENSNINKKYDELFTEHEKMRKVNNDLFLQLGENEPEPDPESDPEPQKLTYENLFDEKGVLKL